MHAFRPRDRTRDEGRIPASGRNQVYRCCMPPPGAERRARGGGGEFTHPSGCGPCGTLVLPAFSRHRSGARTCTETHLRARRRRWRAGYCTGWAGRPGRGRPFARRSVPHALVPGAGCRGPTRVGAGCLGPRCYLSFARGALPPTGPRRPVGPCTAALECARTDGPLSSVRTFCQPPTHCPLSPPAPQSQAPAYSAGAVLRLGGHAVSGCASSGP